MKPRCILEFGSGCSTIILAQALADNERISNVTSFLYSVDADEYWARTTAQSLPEHLQHRCEIVYSPLLKVEYDHIPGFRHQIVPEIAPDFIYLDGPALTKERQVATDLLYIEHNLPRKFCIVVDGRWANVRFLEKHLIRKYQVQKNYTRANTIFKAI